MVQSSGYVPCSLGSSYTKRIEGCLAGVKIFYSYGDVALSPPSHRQGPKHIDGHHPHQFSLSVLGPWNVQEALYQASQ